MSTTYTPPPINGYKPLTQEQVDLINEIKVYFGGFADNYAKKITEIADTPESQECLKDGLKHIRMGAMLCIRAITKPSTFA